MTHNQLILQRLYILTENGEKAYDEKFHNGVNIIRGDNSSGKSTVTHFIFYVLGGAFNDFVPEARKCSEVLAQVKMNDSIFTVKRELVKNDDGNISTQQPLYVFWDIMEYCFNPPEGKTWQKFGYKTTDNRKSFSNVLFENLGLPIVKGDNNITFHQILRLLYVDQESPTNSLFYYENFDNQLTRETVSDLLLGVYDEELYEDKKRLISAEKELESIKSEIKATSKFFSDSLSLSPSKINSTIENREKRLNEIKESIISIRSKESDLNYGEDSQLLFQKLNNEAITQRKLVAEVDEDIASLNREIEDSEYFIDALNRKIKALRNSIQTREFLGNLPLEYCPECLTKIKESDSETNCKLCKEPIDKSFGVVQARRMELEIGFQISESENLLGINRRKLIETESKKKAEEGKLYDIQNQVNQALVDVKSYNEEKIDELNTQKGFIEGEILQYRTLLEKAELYNKLLEERDQLKREIDILKKNIFDAERSQIKLKEDINETIRKEGVYLLNNDLERQDEFKKAGDFYIDYSNNLTFLSNKFSKYSASSNFYLKVSARFAIFLASLKIDEMRFPRFIFADNMEDKGIEIERAQNLQKLLIDRVNSYDPSSFQMIYTTSYITKELNDSDLVVGEYYTKKKPSLRNV